VVFLVIYKNSFLIHNNAKNSSFIKSQASNIASGSNCAILPEQQFSLSYLVFAASSTYNTNDRFDVISACKWLLTNDNSTLRYQNELNPIFGKIFRSKLFFWVVNISLQTHNKSSLTNNQ
jgi:hypothetical protein